MCSMLVCACLSNDGVLSFVMLSLAYACVHWLLLMLVLVLVLMLLMLLLLLLRDAVLRTMLTMMW